MGWWLSHTRLLREIVLNYWEVEFIHHIVPAELLNQIVPYDKFYDKLPRCYTPKAVPLGAILTANAIRVRFSPSGIERFPHGARGLTVGFILTLEVQAMSAWSFCVAMEAANFKLQLIFLSVALTGMDTYWEVNSKQVNCIHLGRRTSLTSSHSSLSSRAT